MAAKKKTEYTCTAVYTEGCEKRLTEALVEVYYNRRDGISNGNITSAKAKDETA